LSAPVGVSLLGGVPGLLLLLLVFSSPGLPVLLMLLLSPSFYIKVVGYSTSTKVIKTLACSSQAIWETTRKKTNFLVSRSRKIWLEKDVAILSI
jgi:hypothetical protein